jgi:threonyl-tRNA synthetase
MIHRAMLGSVERFLGILIEHVAGSFPVWLAPVQAVVLPVSEKFADYGEEVRRRLAESGVRVELDSRNEKLGYRIREAQMQKTPFMLVVGAREKEAGEVALRLRTGDDLGAVSIAKVAERISALSRSRAKELTSEDLA